MSNFEPEYIIALAKLLHGGTKDQKKEYERKWRDNVRTGGYMTLVPWRAEGRPPSGREALEGMARVSPCAIAVCPPA